MCKSRLWVLALALAGAAILLLVLAGESLAQENPQENPLLVEAGVLRHDRLAEKIFILKGARVRWGTAEVIAEEIVYDLKLGTLEASPGSRLVSPKGDRIYAETLFLSDDFSAGTASLILAFLSDDSQFYAESLSIEGEKGEILRFGKAAYSACLPCAAALRRARASGGESLDSWPPAPDAADLKGADEISWRIDANEVVWDSTAQTIRYERALLRVFGLPVFFLPVLTLPGPEVERASGFLAPRIRATSYLGQQLEVSYFQAVSPTTNLTLRPSVSSQRGLGLALDAEQLLRRGAWEFESSLARSEPRAPDGVALLPEKTRGHFDGEAGWDINRNWRVGADLEVASDRSYLRSYRIDPQRSQLTSRLFAERFQGDSYFRAETTEFRSLRLDTDALFSAQPLVVPQAEWSWRGTAVEGFRPTLEGGLRVLRRDGDADSRRLSLRPGLSRRRMTSSGHIFTASAAWQLDLYTFTEAALAATRLGGDSTSAPPTPSPRNQHSVTRSYPVLAAGWSLPLISESGAGRIYLLEPRVQLVHIPGNPNAKETPNEESQNQELDRPHLFRLNRFPGTDRVENGTRLDYGVSWIRRSTPKREAALFVGRSTRLDSTVLESPASSGFTGPSTDWVLGASARRDNWFSLRSDLRLSTDVEQIRSHDSELTLGAPGSLQLELGYFYGLERPPPESLAKREEADMTFRFPSFNRLSAAVNVVQDLERGDSRKLSFSFAYRDDCLGVEFTTFRNRFGAEDGGLDHETGFEILITLITFGSLDIERSREIHEPRRDSLVPSAPSDG